MSTPRSFPSSGINDPYASRDTGLDDTIESSFPASDPPSTIPDPPTDVRESDADDRAWRTEGFKLPSDTFLWAAVGAMGASAVLQAAGKKHASLFVGQWAPAFLLLGIYDKLVKPLGTDGYDPA